MTDELARISLIALDSEGDKLREGFKSVGLKEDVEKTNSGVPRNRILAKVKGNILQVRLKKFSIVTDERMVF
jgi:hypothetical protein